MLVLVAPTMIEDARRLPNASTVEADICIVGSGAAGITVARELLASGKRVVVLAGGGRRERSSDRDLYRGAASGGTTHEPLEENRRRSWGGTTSAWGGRCVPFDPLDFEVREHIPHSGWPIRYDDLLPFYRRANAICEAGDFTYDIGSALPHLQREVLTGFDGSGLVSSHIERWSPPTHFGRRYAKELKAAPNTRVLMHGHATRLLLSGDGSKITGIRAATTPAHGFTVVADDYVLACGGLENARLLLASNDVEPKGIGNAHGNVGRYYMTHLMGVLGGIELTAGVQGLAYGFERDEEGVYCRRRIWVTPEAQTDAQTANAVAFFYRPNISDAGHRSALFSSTYLAKAYVTAFSRRGPRQVWEALRADRSARREHWLVVLKDLPRAVPEALRLFQQRWLAKRRLPSVLGRPSDRFDLFYHTEHVPNPDSRVELDTASDRFGMPRLRTHIAFSPVDFDTVVKFHETVGHRLAETGLGILRYHDPDVAAKLADHLKHFNSQGHHLGTTRMSARPQDGVVDPDCRVHGLENLYVAGGSVFPTGGHANPTLTIVALAVRLADHLRHRARPSDAERHDASMNQPQS